MVETSSGLAGTNQRLVKIQTNLAEADHMGEA